MYKWLFLLVPFYFSCQSVDRNKEELKNYSDLSNSELVQKMDEVNQKIRENVNDGDLYFERSLIFQGGDDLQSAMADIDRAIKIDPNNPDFYIQQAELFIRFRKYRQAESSLITAGKIDPENLSSRLKLAEFYFYNKRLKEGMSFVNEALRIDMYNAEAYFLKGLIHENSGDTSLAISSYQTCIEQDPDYFEAYFQLGMLHAYRGDPLAIEYYDNAIRIKPEEAQSYYNKGLFCQEIGELNEALSAYSALLKIDPNFKEAHFNMGYVNMFFLKQYQQGAVHFSRAIAVFPTYHQAYYNRGYCYELMGDVQRAEIDYRNALEIRPDYTLAAEGLNRVIIN